MYGDLKHCGQSCFEFFSLPLLLFMHCLPRPPPFRRLIVSQMAEAMDSPGMDADEGHRQLSAGSSDFLHIFVEHFDGLRKKRSKAKKKRNKANKKQRQSNPIKYSVPVCALNDDILAHIFSFTMTEPREALNLALVCQKWANVIPNTLVVGRTIKLEDCRVQHELEWPLGILIEVTFSIRFSKLRNINSPGRHWPKETRAVIDVIPWHMVDEVMIHAKDVAKNGTGIVFDKLRQCRSIRHLDISPIRIRGDDADSALINSDGTAIASYNVENSSAISNENFLSISQLPVQLLQSTKSFIHHGLPSHQLSYLMKHLPKSIESLSLVVVKGWPGPHRQNSPLTHREHLNLTEMVEMRIEMAMFEPPDPKEQSSIIFAAPLQHLRLLSGSIHWINDSLPFLMTGNLESLYLELSWQDFDSAYLKTVDQWTGLRKLTISPDDEMEYDVFFSRNTEEAALRCAIHLDTLLELLADKTMIPLRELRIFQPEEMDPDALMALIESRLQPKKTDSSTYTRKPQRIVKLTVANCTFSLREQAWFEARVRKCDFGDCT